MKRNHQPGSKASPRKPKAARSRELLSDIVASSNDAIFSRSLDGAVLTWNPAAENIFGYAAEEMLGRSSSVLLPPGREHEMMEIMQRIRNGDRVAHFETDRQHKDGRLLRIALSVSPIRESRGRIIGASTIAQDITERRRLEAELVEMEEQGRQRLGRDVHDGLGQHLGGLELLCQTLGDRLKRKGLPEASLARLLITQIKQARTMVRTLAMGLTPVINASDGLMQALNQLALSSSVPKRVRCSFLCDEPLLVSDHNMAVQLYRIAQEAVANALRHGLARRVELLLYRRGSDVLLQIRDDGRGFQKRGANSCGMGLRTMRYRSHLIGGRLDIGPANPRGVTVTCTLPLAAVEAPSSESFPRPTQQPARVPGQVLPHPVPGLITSSGCELKAPRRQFDNRSPRSR